LNQQKDEYLCSFLDVVSSLVVPHHLLQPVVHLLLRLAVVAAIVVIVIVAVVIVDDDVDVVSVLPQTFFQHCYTQHLIPSGCQQTKFH
jgi:hypothetical protein